MRVVVDVEVVGKPGALLYSRVLEGVAPHDTAAVLARIGERQVRGVLWEPEGLMARVLVEEEGR